MSDTQPITDQLDQIKPENLYEECLIQEEVDPQKQKQLIQLCLKYDRQWKSFRKKQFFNDQYYYLISVKWLKRWKQYVSYDSITQGKPPQKFFGCGKLPQINEDLIENSKFALFFTDNLSNLNTKLKNGLLEGRDYEFLNEQLWDIFSEFYRIQVKRWVVQTKDGKKVQLYYQQINILTLNMSILKDIEHERITKLQEIVFQFSRHSTVQHMHNSIKDDLSKWAKNQRMASFPSDIPIKYWRMPDDTRKNVLINILHTGCKANPSFSYKLYIDAEYMQQQEKIDKYQLMNDTFIVAEMRQSRDNWCFFNLANNLQASCSFCKNVAILTVICSCKYAVYCSKRCKQSDKSNHKFRCPNDAESEQEDKQLKLTNDSKKGLMGLRNLGNTCFMNSGLQCLIHIFQLTQYFLKDIYIHDINKTNPLGTQGELSTNYAKLVKQAWFGDDSSVAPTHLKRSIGKFQKMFSGYDQQDSGQLITFMLDGLHEDLNRVKEKKPTQTKESDGRPDSIVAKQAWQTFLIRNQSIIVDLMYGQFKSIVNCPQCSYTSITFDPFLVCTLPLVDNNKKQIQIVYIKDHIYTKKIYVTYSTDEKVTMRKKIPEIRQIVGISDNAEMLLFVASYSSCDIVDLDQSIDYIRKQYKYRTLCLRVLMPHQNPKTDIKIMLANVVTHSYSSDESYRKNVIPYRLYFINPKSTNKQVYLQLLSYYSKILSSQNSADQFEKNYIKVDEKQDIFRLLMIPTSRYYTCNYCDKKKCDGCKLPFSNDLFSKYIKWNQSSEEDVQKRYQIQLYWRKNQKQIEKIFDQIKEETDHTFGQINSKAGTNIYDCIKLFERKEILNEQNAWYCPKCKDFVLASKQMSIFKAPKIFVLCLKRFKRKDYYLEKFNVLVDFPINGFNLNNYVANRSLPHDFSEMEVEQDLIYDLIGVSNHYGSTGGGHYTAFCKDLNSNDWYDFDDSNVSKLKNAQDVISENAYILFYKRREL